MMTLKGHSDLTFAHHSTGIAKGTIHGENK